MSGKFLEKVLDVIGTGVGMPQFVNGEVMLKRALQSVRLTPRRASPVGKARRTCIGACVGSYIPYETGHPVEGQPNLGKVIELTMNNGFDPRTKKQIGPKTGDPENFKTFEELYAAFEKQLQFCEDALRRGAWIASMLNAEVLPVRLALHPDRRLHRDRQGGLGRRGQLLHGRPDLGGRRGCRQLADGGEEAGVRRQEADHGRAEEGPGGQLRRGIREGREDVL